MRNLTAAYEHALKQYPKMPRLTQAALAAKVGRDQGYISRLLRLDALPERVKELMDLGILSEAHAIELLPLGRATAGMAPKAASRIVKAMMSARAWRRACEKTVAIWYPLHVPEGSSESH